jgi:hypothetical protein
MIRLLIFINCFILLFNCKNNQEVDFGNTVDFRTANKEMRELILPFMSLNDIDLFFVGVVDLELNPDNKGCKRKYHFKRSEFDRCKLLVLSILIINNNKKPFPGVVALDTFNRFCKLQKVYFLKDSSLEGEINLCRGLNSNDK